jgi:hypothetical protein
VGYRLNLLFVIGFMAIVLTACRTNAWNPDEQFAEQLKVQEDTIRKTQFEKKQNISLDLVRIETNALVQIQSGILVSELNDIMGSRFELLAKIPDVTSVWESRRYRVGHLIASHFGQTSKEFGSCEQDRELFTLTLANGVVRTVEY